MFGLGVTELAVIGAIIFLLFGGKIMNNFFTGIAGAIKESKKTLKEINEPLKEIDNE